ncbi:hypothetical protein BDF19DRAFT_412062 [Syncephalis fuscata]|nr:hypothetical protein BDF19DRAFT_412062 [Syncephalis fuscata]
MVLDYKQVNQASLNFVDPFSSYDTDGDRAITEAELKKALIASGSPVSDETLSKLFANLDCNKDGQVKMLEFVKHKKQILQLIGDQRIKLGPKITTRDDADRVSYNEFVRILSN